VLGELGEYANLHKHYVRGDITLDEFRTKAADELADVQCYLDILALQLDIDLGAATVSKFNRVSVRVGCEVFLIAEGDDPDLQLSLQIASPERQFAEDDSRPRVSAWRSIGSAVLFIAAFIVVYALGYTRGRNVSDDIVQDHLDTLNARYAEKIESLVREIKKTPQ